MDIRNQLLKKHGRQIPQNNGYKRIRSKVPYCKITKSKRSFSSDQALLKLMYLVQKEVTAKWAKKPVFRLKTIKAQLLLMFPDRINLDTLC